MITLALHGGSPCTYFWLLHACWPLLLSAQPRLSEKSEHFNCLIIILSFFLFSRSTYSLVSLVDFLVPPSYLVPVYLVAPLPWLPSCTSMQGVSLNVPVLTATRGSCVECSYIAIENSGTQTQRSAPLWQSFSQYWRWDQCSLQSPPVF